MKTLLLTKNYRDAAEGVMRLAKNGVMTERQEERDELTVNFIEVVGDFQALDMDALDLWGGHLKFVLQDTEPADEEELQLRGNIAMQAPELAALFTSKTHMTVYLQKSDEWEEVTEDFDRIIRQRNLFRPTRE